MNIDVPNIVKAAVGDENRTRNVRIVSDNMTNHNRNDPGFLSKEFRQTHSLPKLFITAEDEAFDTMTLQEWSDEGFNVEYLPMGDDTEKYAERLRNLHKKGLGPCEIFGIVGMEARESR